MNASAPIGQIVQLKPNTAPRVYCHHCEAVHPLASAKLIIKFRNGTSLYSGRCQKCRTSIQQKIPNSMGGNYGQ